MLRRGPARTQVFHRPHEGGRERRRLNRMLRERGYGDVAVAYSDSCADLPLLKAAHKPVVVNPKKAREAFFRRVLPRDTPILNWGCQDRGGERGA